MLNPIRTVHDAVSMPFKALWVTGLCLVINLMTSPSHLWVKWVAFGMAIAVLVTWARALKLLIAGGLVAAIGLWAYKRWGDDGRRRVERFFAAPRA